MIDLVPLIDAIGEPATAVAVGGALGLAFGVFAERSGFCTRSALTGLLRRTGGGAAAVWLAGFAAAVLSVQYLIWSGHVDVTETRFFSTAQSLSGAIFGGLVFGAGMVLARGCVSRHLVLAASGNMRALVTTLVIAVAGLATYSGALVPLRDIIGGIWNTSAIGGNDLLAHAGLTQAAGLLIGAGLAVSAVLLTIRASASLYKVAGGIGAGLTVAGGWYLTYALSTQVFEPVPAESLSFIRPLATTGELVLGASDASGFDQGVLPGVILGAFVASLLGRSFRIAGFGDPDAAHPLRYIAGGALMGFGGILAVGCTIGAGFTGGSVLAVSSLAGLASMIVGAAITDRLIERDSYATGATSSAVAIPAE